MKQEDKVVIRKKNKNKTKQNKQTKPFLLLTLAWNRNNFNSLIVSAVNNGWVLYKRVYFQGQMATLTEKIRELNLRQCERRRHEDDELVVVLQSRTIKSLEIAVSL